MTFQEQIIQGIPSVLPKPKPYESEINHAPKRKEILSEELREERQKWATESIKLKSEIRLAQEVL
jgi:urocanate hydratase